MGLPCKVGTDVSRIIISAKPGFGQEPGAHPPLSGGTVFLPPGAGDRTGISRIRAAPHAPHPAGPRRTGPRRPRCPRFPQPGRERMGEAGENADASSPDASIAPAAACSGRCNVGGPVGKARRERGARLTRYWPFFTPTHDIVRQPRISPCARTPQGPWRSCTSPEFPKNPVASHKIPRQRCKYGNEGQAISGQADTRAADRSPEVQNNKTAGFIQAPD